MAQKYNHYVNQYTIHRPVQYTTSPRPPLAHFAALRVGLFAPIEAFCRRPLGPTGQTPLSHTLGYALLNYRFATAVNMQFGLAKLSYSRSLLASSYKLLHIDPVAIPDLASHFYKYFAPHLVLHGRRADGLLADHLTLTDDLQTGDSDRGFSPEASTGILEPMPSNYRPISVTTASGKSSAMSPNKAARPSCNCNTVSVLN